MSNINTAAFSGNLVADPELRYTPSEFPIATVRVAVNKSKKVADGSYEEVASYLDVTVLGKFAEVIDRKLRKGDRVTVQAEIEQQRWEDKNDGSKRSKVVFLARDIDSPSLFLKDEDVKAKEDGSTSAAASSNGAGAAAPAAADDDIPF